MAAAAALTIGERRPPSSSSSSSLPSLSHLSSAVSVVVVVVDWMEFLSLRLILLLYSALFRIPYIIAVA